VRTFEGYNIIFQPQRRPFIPSSIVLPCFNVVRRLNLFGVRPVYYGGLPEKGSTFKKTSLMQYYYVAAARGVSLLLFF